MSASATKGHAVERLRRTDCSARPKEQHPQDMHHPQNGALSSACQQQGPRTLPNLKHFNTPKTLAHSSESGVDAIAYVGKIRRIAAGR